MIQINILIALSALGSAIAVGNMILACYTLIQQRRYYSESLGSSILLGNLSPLHDTPELLADINNQARLAEFMAMTPSGMIEAHNAAFPAHSIGPLMLNASTQCDDATATVDASTQCHALEPYVTPNSPVSKRSVYHTGAVSMMFEKVPDIKMEVWSTIKPPSDVERCKVALQASIDKQDRIAKVNDPSSFAAKFPAVTEALLANPRSRAKIEAKIGLPLSKMLDMSEPDRHMQYEAVTLSGGMSVPRLVKADANGKPIKKKKGKHVAPPPSPELNEASAGTVDNNVVQPC